VTSEIIEIEAQRRAAMIAGDLAALDQIIDDTANYVHTNGVCETKAQFLQCVANGTYRYREVRQDELNVANLDDYVAVVTGHTTLVVLLPDGAEKVVNSRSVVIWVKSADGWKLRHYQGTSAKPR
jgi:ketosteroid isomerase-like protein